MTDVTDLAERLIGDIDALDAERNLAVYERDARLVAREYVALSARLAQAQEALAREIELRVEDEPAAVRRQAERAEQAEVRLREYEEALRGVSNAYGCFAGCTGALAGAPGDGSGHTPACRAARAALAGDTDG
jgi:hypothetical protein